MNKTDMLEIGAILIGGLAIVAVMGRGGSTEATAAPEQVTPLSSASQAAPGYLGYNQATQAAGNSLGLSPVAAAQNGNTNATGQSCACSATPVQFASQNDFAAYLTATNQNIVTQYQNNILAAMPEWMGQFINNTLAPDLTAAAEGNFSMLAGQ